MFRSGDIQNFVFLQNQQISKIYDVIIDIAI